MPPRPPDPTPPVTSAGDRSYPSLPKVNALVHNLSHLAFAFALAGMFYQVKAFLSFHNSGTHAGFVTDLVLALTMWGFFMAFLGLADPDRMTARELEFVRRRAVWQCRIGLFLVISALLCLAGGVALLVLADDQLQGVAIICFGTGMLGLVRFLHGRLKTALATPPAGE